LSAITPTLIAVGIVNVVTLPLMLWLMERFIGKRLDCIDEGHERARKRREAERTIILAMCRTMLLNNYESCLEKGYYTAEEREVYHKLYEAYKEDGGNSVIDDIAPRIRQLPTRQPKEA